MKKEINELKIEITSDFVCPWCYVGEVRLEKALAQVNPKIPVNIVFRPYELRADMPAGGRNRKEVMLEKFGPERTAEWKVACNRSALRKELNSIMTGSNARRIRGWRTG